MDRVPMVRVVMPMVVGIVAARWVELPIWLLLFFILVCCVAGWFGLKDRIGRVYIFCSLLFTAMLLMALHKPARLLPQTSRIDMVLHITSNPVESGRWQRGQGVVTEFRNDCSEQWLKADEKVVVYVDTCYKIPIFTTVVCRGYANPIDNAGGGYGSLMAVRGYFNKIFLSPGTVLSVADKPNKTPAYFAAKLHSWGGERVARLDLPSAEMGVVATMVVGDSRSMERGVRSEYSRTGAAHLLAVSGLHVGIVFVLINLLLLPMSLLPKGHIWKNLVAVVLIFGYAAMSGLSPSVLRSALMFSFAQIALATSNRGNSLNIMLGSAVVLLAINPNYLFDVSFQLSYAAVLSIMLFYRPLYSLLRCRFKVVNMLSGVVVVGVAATVGTAPLVAYYFCNFPLIGVLINPAVIITANIIVMGGVLWVVAPIAFVQPIAAWVVGGAATVQNAIVGWSANQSWAALTVEMPLWGVLLCYALLTAFGIWYYTTKKQQTNSHNRKK